MFHMGNDDRKYRVTRRAVVCHPDVQLSRVLRTVCIGGALDSQTSGQQMLTNRMKTALLLHPKHRTDNNYEGIPKELCITTTVRVICGLTLLAQLLCDPRLEMAGLTADH